MTDEPTLWHTIDFRPDHNDLHAVFVNTDGTTTTDPIIGWLTQDRVAYDAHTGETFSPPDGVIADRRVVAATLDPDTGEPDYPGDCINFVGIAGASLPEPTAERIAAVQERMKR